MAAFADLYEAVLQCDYTRIEELVQSGLDVNCRDSMKWTALYHAAEHYFWLEPHWVILKLVELGANVNAKDIRAMTPLHYSVSKNAFQFMKQKLQEVPFLQWGLWYLRDDRELAEKTVADSVEQVQVAAIRLLVKLGADINAKFSRNLTSLHRAVQLGRVQVVKCLVKLGADVNIETLVNYTSLNYVVSQAKFFEAGQFMLYERLIECLVELGADMNPFDSLHPIHEAVERGSLDIIQVLVENGANIDVKRYYSVSPVYQNSSKKVIELLARLGADLNAKIGVCSLILQTVKMGRTDILEYLVNQRKGNSPLWWLRATGASSGTVLSMSVANAEYEKAKFLVKLGADVNVRYGFVDSLLFAVRQGDTKMVRTLVRLGADINASVSGENITVLHQLVFMSSGSEGLLKFMLEHGGDVNVLADNHLLVPVHEAVVREDIDMLQVLSELGANLNLGINQGIDLLDSVLNSCVNPNIDVIKVLVEAGINLNTRYTRGQTPLHVAVKLGSIKMIQALGELRADMNIVKAEGWGPLISAINISRPDIVQYLASRNTVDLNVKYSSSVGPLHDAVTLGNAEIIRCLIASGAKTKNPKTVNSTPLYFAIHCRNHEMVRSLIECGADLNAKSTVGITVLHDAIESLDSNTCMTIAEAYFREGTELYFASDVTPLIWSMFQDDFDIAETLLKCGADPNEASIITNPSDAARRRGKFQLAAFLAPLEELLVGKRVSQEGINALHRACHIGHLDLARLLIIEGCDVHKKDFSGKQAFDHLPLIRVADYHTLRETLVMEKVVEEVPSNFVSVLGCQDMQSLLKTLGIGDVRCIPTPSSTVILERVTTFLKSVTDQGRMLPWKEVRAIGSAAEGTKVGLPNEMDFLFVRQMGKGEEQTIQNFGNGYVQFDYTSQGWKRYGGPSRLMMSGSAGFHFDFFETRNYFALYKVLDYLDEEKTLVIRNSLNPRVKDTNRKACSALSLTWYNVHKMDEQIVIWVDFVPCFHVDSWPVGGITRTWLMDEKELRHQGYVLVPKPPHVKSDLAKECTKDQLQTLWKISFPHLETEHMQRLEQRVKDVYLTAKCLRNPDACRIMIRDNGSSPRGVDKYLTSYLLKMCFFKNVEHFREANLGLEEMVCKVYEDLEAGLVEGFIPLFFLPNVSALRGIKLDVSKSAKVARIMARFVRALYLRDCIGDEETVPQKRNSVYRTYELNNQ